MSDEQPDQTGNSKRAPTHFLTDPARIDETAWNAWRVSNPWVPVNLQAADLSHADLVGINLSRCDLSTVGLCGADLRRADLSGADLSGAKLSGADLNGADLVSANLNQADLTGASLYVANLSHAWLRKVDLTRAKLAGANFYGAAVDGAILDGTELMSAMAMGHPDVCSLTVVGSGANWCSALRNQITGGVKIWAYGDVYDSVELCRDLVPFFAGPDATECHKWLDLVEHRFSRGQDRFLSTEQIKQIKDAGGSATNPNRPEHRGIVAALPGNVKIHRPIGRSGWAVTKTESGEFEGDPVGTLAEAVKLALEESARITGGKAAAVVDPGVRS